MPQIAVSAATLNQGLLDGDETRKALYATATIEAGGLEIMPGIRYEDNDYSARFWQGQGQGADARFVNGGRRYDHLDPGVLAAWRPDDRWVVRGAVRSSYARPAFNQLAGPTTVSRDPGTNAILSVTEPNPDRARSRHGATIWVSNSMAMSAGMRRLAVYHKDLSDILVPTGTRSVGETIDGIVRIRPANGRSGKATGVEASGRFTLGDMVSSPLLRGIGIGGNVTWQRTEATCQIAANDIVPRACRRRPA